jgi:hypothetical protein
VSTLVQVFVMGRGEEIYGGADYWRKGYSHWAPVDENKIKERFTRQIAPFLSEPKLG